MNPTKVGKQRQSIHSENGTRRFFRDPNTEDIIGAKGEAYFAKEFNLPMDTRLLPEGNKGVNFVTALGNINVSTARKPYNLLVKVREAHYPIDIHVLIHYDEKDNTLSLIGWEYHSEMLKCPTREFGYGIVNHYKPADDLRDIESLKEQLGVTQT